MYESDLYADNTTDVDIWSCDYPTPSSGEVGQKIYDLGPKVMATMIVPGVLVFLMIIMFIEEVIFLTRNTKKWKVTAYKIWILSSYPIFSILGYTQLFIPRASDIITYTSSFFFVIVIKKYFNYIMYLYGGKHGMINTFKYKKTTNFRPFPCCFCFWCSRGPLTMKRLHMLQILMYHGLVFYPINNFLTSLLQAEGIGGSINASLGYAALNFSATISSFVCLYALSIIYKASRQPLEEFFIRGKYMSIQFIIIFDTIQGSCVRLCGILGIIPCGFPYPVDKNAELLQQYLLIVELFFVSLLARHAYRRTDEDAKVIPHPPVDEYGNELPVTAIKLDGPIKKLDHSAYLRNAYATVYPYNDSEDGFRIQIESSSSSSTDLPPNYSNHCFIPDF